jgi:protein-tyrosine phosphatase
LRLCRLVAQPAEGTPPGKKAMLQSWWTSLLVAITPARRFVRPLQAPARRFVFVCAGNICRSPFAEHLARHLGADAVSMGLSADPGKRANEAAARNAATYGVDLSAHRARRVAEAELDPGDLLLGFELWHVQALESLASVRGCQLRLVGGFAGWSKCHLYDPYGLPDSAFQYSFARIADAVGKLAKSNKVAGSAAPQ